MSRSDTMFASSAAGMLQSLFGDTITYAGEAVPARVLGEPYSEDDIGDGAEIVRRVDFVVSNSDVSSPADGDAITIGGVNYWVDRPAPAQGGDFHLSAVTRETTRTDAGEHRMGRP